MKQTNGLRPLVAQWERAIWTTMARQEMAYRVIDKVRSSQVLTFRLRLADSRQLKKALGLDEQLALALGVARVRVARHLGYLDVEVGLPAAYHQRLSVTALDRKGGVWVALGQTSIGTPVYVNLGGNRTCHALVTGATGSGKTVAERLIAWTLSTDNDPDQVQLVLIDGAKKGAAWWGFERDAHLAHPIIVDSNEAIAALAWAVAELDRRMEQERRTPRLFVIIDEVRALLNVAGDDVAQAVEHIASVGREFGVHIVVATQHALTDALGGSIAKANLAMRLSGRVADAHAAYVATGVRASGAEALQGNGDFLLIVAGEAHRLQIAIVENRELGRLPRRETVPQLDLNAATLDRALEVAQPGSPRKDVDNEPEAVAYALATSCGVGMLRDRYGPMGTDRARRIRDFARAMRRALPGLGYIYPLPLTTISAETARRAQIPAGVVGQ